MSLRNFRDLSSTQVSTGAGFQFEFYCQNCTATWKSPFKPYRPGQLMALFGLFASFLPGQAHMAARGVNAFSDARSRGARDEALAAAQQQAQAFFKECHECGEGVCEADCWDSRQQMCKDCVAKAAGKSTGNGAPSASAGAAGAMTTKCPNCQATVDGGRFCAECGFDMASTHKSCPGCGTLLPRQARFCTDCGHAF